jgi:hypothetical protein
MEQQDWQGTRAHHVGRRAAEDEGADWGMTIRTHDKQLDVFALDHFGNHFFRRAVNGVGGDGVSAVPQLGGGFFQIPFRLVVNVTGAQEMAAEPFE